MTLWSVRGAGWFCLWALDLVEVLGGRAYGETLLVLVFDSAGSAEVVFGLTGVVIEAFTLFSLFCFRLLEFLLLWLVRDWLSILSLIHEAHPLLSSGRDTLLQEFVTGRSWWWLFAPCVASSVSCERECSCS
ncbi:hypothetical protein Taro_031665, partial [Colocasia esculenta]|nr:hypothetical protein [Colocasia esculenta]